ncbi:hypothetical protein ACFSCZ_03470 [Siminovitchia sediminis]|uniref:Secreted protein n=1 Tax=Siminovitchia sediminis TaxID=1274353 RepID=A0ABW4KHZ3_9BACI
MIINKKLHFSNRTNKSRMSTWNHPALVLIFLQLQTAGAQGRFKKTNEGKLRHHWYLLQRLSTLSTVFRFSYWPAAAPID